MKAIRSWTTPNPILVKELRSRMRGSRAFITLTLALVIMALMMIAVVSLLTQASNLFGSMLSPQIGRILFEGLVNFELLLVCTVTPAVTSGAISNEREKLTFEMLLATPLGPAKILWGKLISALSYVFLLIFAAIPLASMVFLFGGVAPLTMLKAMFILVVVAVTMGIYGLFLSALLGRTGRATVVSFISMIAIMILPLVALIASNIFYRTQVIFPRIILAFSPISMLISAVETVVTNFGGVTGLFGFLGGQWDPSMNPIALTQIPRPIYHYSLALYGGLSIILFTLTVALVNPARRFYLSKRNALTGAAALLGFAAIMGSAFLLTAPRYEWIQAPANNGNPIAARVAPGIAMPAVQVQAVGIVQAYPAPGPSATPVAISAAYPAPELTPTPTLVTAQLAAMPLKDQIAIYAAAARQVYLKDSSYSNPDHPFPVVYLVSVTNDRVADPQTDESNPVSIAADLQAGITAALSDLPARIAWCPPDAIPKDAKGYAVQEGGVAITFGNIRVQTDSKVLLPASALITPMIGAGQTYILEKVDGLWKITGISGTRWIS